MLASYITQFTARRWTGTGQGIISLEIKKITPQTHQYNFEMAPEPALRRPAVFTSAALRWERVKGGCWDAGPPGRLWRSAAQLRHNRTFCWRGMETQDELAHWNDMEQLLEIRNYRFEKLSFHSLSIYKFISWKPPKHTESSTWYQIICKINILRAARLTSLAWQIRHEQMPSRIPK